MVVLYIKDQSRIRKSWKDIKFIHFAAIVFRIESKIEVSTNRGRSRVRNDSKFVHSCRSCAVIRIENSGRKGRCIHDVDRNQFSTGNVPHDRENLYNSRVEDEFRVNYFGFPSATRFAHFYDRRKLPSFFP